MQPETQAKFLIIRFSSIGDIVLTTPVVRCLKKQIEDALVHYLTKPQFAGILASNPYVDKVHVLKENFAETITELQEEHFDYIIDLHHNLRSARVVSALKLGSFSFKKLNIQKWLLVNFNINKMPEKHIVDRYLDTLIPFDVHNDNEGLDFFIPQNDEINITKQFGEEFSYGFVAFIIGAKHFTKQLPSQKIADICNQKKFPLILLGGPEDEKKAVEIFALLSEKNIVTNACGKLNLNQSASVVSQAKVVITHDTGLMHIAAAYKQKIVSIWGNTVPEFGMYPYLADKNSVIMQKDLKCRPCSKIGFTECPKNHFRCMNDIDSNEIVRAVQKLFIEE